MSGMTNHKPTKCWDFAVFTVGSCIIPRKYSIPYLSTPFHSTFSGSLSGFEREERTNNPLPKQPPFQHSEKISYRRWGKTTPTLLVAPYCAIPRDYLSDTLLLRAMGFLMSQHGRLGAAPFSERLPPWRACEVEVGYPPPLRKGYLSDSCAIHYENKANGCDTLRYYLERVLRDMGGYLALGR